VGQKVSKLVAVHVQTPQSTMPPQPSATMPHCSSVHISGVMGVQHWPSTHTSVAPPHEQSIVPPQPSSIIPHCVPHESTAAGVQHASSKQTWSSVHVAQGSVLLVDVLFVDVLFVDVLLVDVLLVDVLFVDVLFGGLTSGGSSLTLQPAITRMARISAYFMYSPC
jgi:hypothetical protein